MSDGGTGDPDVLLVEDNHGDVNLIRRAYDRRALPGSLHVVDTGERALDWSNQRGEFADVPRPDLVLLDLNLPETSGYTVLSEIKSDPNLDAIPVVVLTGSRSDDDVKRVYDDGANAYLAKPADPDEFAELVELTVAFWTSAAVLPADPEPATEG